MAVIFRDTITGTVHDQDSGVMLLFGRHMRQCTTRTVV